MRIEIVNLKEARTEGQRRMPYRSIVLMAEQLNTSNYILPGPKGYLSPSTMAEWQMCPHAVYQKQILRAAPRKNGLAAVFGSAQHEAIADGFQMYKDHGYMDLNPMLVSIESYVTTELARIIPAEIWSDPDGFLSGVIEPGERGLCEDAFIARGDMLSPTLLQVKAMLRNAPLLHKSMFRELEKDTVEEFIGKVDKRMEDATTLFHQYVMEEWYKQICEPEEIEGIEEDMFVVFDGVPVYFVADLITSKGVYDHKFTTASAISRRWEKIPTDIQLWIYELVYGRPSHLLLYAPPAKTSRGKPRDLVVDLPRRAEEHRLQDNQYFLDLIAGIPRDIENGCFEKRGKCFMGDCGACEAYEVCTRHSAEMPELTIDSVSNLKRKSHAVDLKKLKADLIKEAEEETGLSQGDFGED